MPYPGTELHAKAKREGLLVSEDWTRMEYSYYLLRGNGLDEPTVMGAINRAKRRFYLRPGHSCGIRETSSVSRQRSGRGLARRVLPRCLAPR